MSAAALLQRCEAAGVTLRLDPPDTIVVSGPAEGRARHLPEVRANKPALVALLAADHAEAIREAVAERASLTETLGGLPRPKAQEVAALAGKFYEHHWRCAVCRAGTLVGAGLHKPCPEGAALWVAYCAAAGREVRP